MIQSSPVKILKLNLVGLFFEPILTSPSTAKNRKSDKPQLLAQRTPTYQTLGNFDKKLNTAFFKEKAYSRTRMIMLLTRMD